MLERRFMGTVPPKPHTLFTYEQKHGSEFVFTRDGFRGGFSILYTKEAPTALVKAESYHTDVDIENITGKSVTSRQLPLARRHILTPKITLGNNWLSSRVALFLNNSCRISIIRGSVDSSSGFSNGDADELFFVTKGAGVFFTMFGALDFKQHDYVLIPKGVSYAVNYKTDNVEMLLIEGKPNLGIPQEFRNPHGQLRLEAPYTHRDFHSPSRLLTTSESAIFCDIVVLKDNFLTHHTYRNCPYQVIGWDGSVYPLTFNIHNYLPKTGKIHLPPNLHLTFNNSQFVVCSFVPRALDYGEGAISCPYPHENVCCDEIIYYVSGNFSSRQGIAASSMSYHPAGMPHGPQPGKYHASVGKKYTDELAVMIDAWDKMYLTKRALEVEDKTYITSWSS